jgi:hypothetical protein
MVEDRTITLDALGDVFSWAFWIWIPEDYAISSLRTSVATASVFNLIVLRMRVSSLETSLVRSVVFNVSTSAEIKACLYPSVKPDSSEAKQEHYRPVVAFKLQTEPTKYGSKKTSHAKSNLGNKCSVRIRNGSNQKSFTSLGDSNHVSPRNEYTLHVWVSMFN